MGSTKLLSLATASLLLCGSPIAAARSEAPLAALDVQVRSGYSPAIVRALARLGEPTPVTLAVGETVSLLIEARCGTVDPAYVQAFLEENRGAHPALTIESLQQPAAGTKFQFPYCLPRQTVQTSLGTQNRTISHIFAERGMPFDARAAQEALLRGKRIDSPSLSSLELSEISIGAERFADANIGFAATENARRFVRENIGINPLNIPPHRPLTVEAPVRIGTMPVREGFTEAEARQALEAAAEPGTLRVDEAQVAELIDDVPLDPEECKDALDNADWPVASGKLRASLEANDQLRPGSRNPATVLLIDTGFDAAMKGRPVPATSLGTMRDFTGLGLAVHSGINTALRVNDATPPAALQSRFHGGEVAAALLGGFLNDEDRALLPSRVTFASIAQTQGPRAYLDIAAISAAYGVALQSDIKIVNASVAAEAYREIFINALRATGGRTLLIAAAGNVPPPSPQEFPANASTWPATLGGVHQLDGAPVVTVGAHNPGGGLLSFSRSGKDRVDLLAPGCLIPTYTYDPAAASVVPVRRNGTSYAAPIVAMVAGLLAAEGMHPTAIKDRLLASVDMDEALFPHVQSAGRLNVTKALSVWRDWVRYRRSENGQTVEMEVSGLLQGGHLRLQICGQGVEWRDVRKLAVTTRAAEPRDWAQGWRIVDRTTRRMVQIPRCPLSEVRGELTVQDAAGINHSIPASDIIDFVAREG